MQIFWSSLSLIFTVIYIITPLSAEIHRAKSIKYHKPRRAVFEDEDLSPPGVRYSYDDHNIPCGVPNPYIEPPGSIHANFDGATSKTNHDGMTWVYSLLSAALVGLSGIFPLLIIRVDGNRGLGSGTEQGNEEFEGGRLRMLLSFAVGGLLGDIFLHLLPETWAHIHTIDDHISCGLWVLTGLLSFLFIEKIFPDSSEAGSDADSTQEISCEDLDHTIQLASYEHNSSPNAKQKKRKKNKNKSSEITAIDDSYTINSNGNLLNDSNSQILKNSASMLCQTSGNNAKTSAVTNGKPLANGKSQSNRNILSNGKLLSNGKPLSNGEIMNGKAVSNGKAIINGKAVSNGKSHANWKSLSNGSSVGNGSCGEGYKLPGEQKNGKAAVATGKHAGDHSEAPASRVKISGWLNLLANVIDNFTHGLAVAASYSVSTKTGVLTTLAILLHEIPHEIGDFAILLRSGFDRWKAAKAQLVTATGGICGAFVALCASSVQQAGNQSSWMLPFTSGGFLYIALVTVLPDLLADNKPMESLKQILLLLLGISIMSLVTYID